MVCLVTLPNSVLCTLSNRNCIELLSRSCSRNFPCFATEGCQDQIDFFHHHFLPFAHFRKKKAKHYCSGYYQDSAGASKKRSAVTVMKANFVVSNRDSMQSHRALFWETHSCRFDFFLNLNLLIEFSQRGKEHH